MRKIALAALAAALLCGTVAHAQNLVQNPSFGSLVGTPPITFVHSDDHWTLSPAATVVNSGFFWEPLSQFPGEGALSVSQDIVTTIGQAYDLSFSFFNLTELGDLLVSFGDFSATITGGDSSIISMATANFHIDGADITSGLTTLSFQVPGVNNPGDFGIAGVSLTASAPNPGVPEPDAWALMIVGFGLAGVALRDARDRAIRAR